MVSLLLREFHLSEFSKVTELTFETDFPFIPESIAFMTRLHSVSTIFTDYESLSHLIQAQKLHAVRYIFEFILERMVQGHAILVLDLTQCYCSDR